LTGILQTTYDDNINTSDENEEDAVYTIPRLRVAMDWALTPHIQLGSAISVGYRYYLSGDGKDDIYVGFDDDLGTTLKADIILGEGVLRIADSYSRSTDNLEIAGRTDNDDYALNRNRFSMKYSVDPTPFWKLIAEIGRKDTWTSTKQYEYQNNVTQYGDIVGLWQMNKQFRVGPYVRYETVDYDKNNNDRKVPEAGMSFIYQREAGFRVSGSLGYEQLEIEEGNGLEDETEGGVTGSIACSFATSEFTNHVFSFRHNRDQDILASQINYSEETTYKYAISSNIMPDVNINGDVALLDIKESDNGEKAKIWRVGLGTAYELGAQARIRLRYEFWDKNSDQDGSDYKRNRVSTYLEYDF